LQELLGLRSAQSGNVMVTFALALIPIMGAVGGAVDYSRASSARAAIQAALDSAALGTIQTASTQTPGQIQSTALALFNASFTRLTRAMSR
jgi:Flp pilus assembly protein TadG